MATLNKSKAGFTLTEVMVASSILMLFMAGFLGAFIMGMRTLDMSVNQYRATAIARNRVQRARGFDFGSLHLLEETETRVDRYGNIDPLGEYRRSTLIDTNTVTAPHTVRVEVGVRFPVRGNPNRQRSEPVLMESIIAVRM
ncbi:MAG: type IV pilus modification PilV family protein [Kiritimatiellia bacterium]